MGLIGNKEFFKGINDINYEGKDSKNPFAFKYYNPDQLFEEKKLDILVATSVIEVGIDIPDATVIIIEGQIDSD